MGSVTGHTVGLFRQLMQSRSVSACFSKLRRTIDFELVSVSKLAKSEAIADKVWNELIEIWTPVAPSVADIVRA
jgi:hypothetical protein